MITELTEILDAADRHHDYLLAERENGHRLQAMRRIFRPLGKEPKFYSYADVPPGQPHPATGDTVETASIKAIRNGLNAYKEAGQSLPPADAELLKLANDYLNEVNLFKMQQSKLAALNLLPLPKHRFGRQGRASRLKDIHAYQEKMTICQKALHARLCDIDASGPLLRDVMTCLQKGPSYKPATQFNDVVLKPEITAAKAYRENLAVCMTVYTRLQTSLPILRRPAVLAAYVQTMDNAIVAQAKRDFRAAGQGVLAFARTIFAKKTMAAKLVIQPANPVPV